MKKLLNDNVMWKQYEDVRDGNPNAQRSLDTAFSIIHAVMRNVEKPVAFIMQETSRYVEHPDNLGTDHFGYSILRMATQSHQSLSCPSNPEKRLSNLIFMLADKVNDIPAWFYLNNPLVRTVSIPLPDREIRRTFIKEFLDDEDYLPADFSSLSEEEQEKALKKYTDTFIAETDGFRVKEMQALLSIMKSKGMDLSRISTAATLFKHGTDQNPWENGDLVGKLPDIEDILRKRVKGQDSAVQSAADVLRAAILGLSGLQHSSKGCRPKGILFLAGPTGVGKTELAKAISEFVFGTEEHVVRFDMSEYREAHSDARLLGAPPGYVGYEQGGQLTEAIKREPFSVLLFDEIEKAHPSILDKFLQILEDGRLTDSKGETVYFSNALIIFTSNLGIIERVLDPVTHREKNVQVAEYGSDGCNEEDADKANEMYNAYASGILSRIDDHFIQIARPEIKNRIGDNFIIFSFISEKAVEMIAEKKLEQITEAYLAEKDIHINFAESFYQSLYEAIKNEDKLKDGGRGVGNMIESCFTKPFGKYMSDSGIKAGDTVIITGFTKSKGVVELTCEKTSK